MTSHFLAASGSRRKSSGITPPATEWYDILWARRLMGDDVGAPPGPKLDVPTWVSQTIGATTNLSEALIDGSGVIADGVDFTGRRLDVDGTNHIVRNSTGDIPVPAGDNRNWDFDGAFNSLVQNVTINNLAGQTGSAGIFYPRDPNNNSGLHEIDNLLFLQPGLDAVTGPVNGILRIRNSVVIGATYTTLAHLDIFNVRGALPGSFIEKTVVVVDVDPSAPAPGNGTGVNNTVRNADGYTIDDFRISQCVFVGADRSNSSTMIAFRSASTNIVLDRVLVDPRAQNVLFNNSAGIEDWDVYFFDSDQARIDGFITIGGPVPYTGNLTPLAPEQMLPPVIWPTINAINYGPMVRPRNKRSHITGYTILYSSDGIVWSPVSASLDGGSFPVTAANDYRVRVFATNGVGNGVESVDSNLINVSAF